MNERIWHYSHNFDYGQVNVSIPDKLSEADCNDLEEHFALIMKQCRRRILPKAFEQIKLDKSD